MAQSDAVVACSILAKNGYELPHGAAPLLARGPLESLVALAGLGLLARLLAYLALLGLDRRKR